MRECDGDGSLHGITKPTPDPERENLTDMTEKTVTYDPEVIERYAKHLYSVADLIKSLMMLAWGAVGVSIGLVVGAGAGSLVDSLAMAGLLGCVAGGWMGARLGKTAAETTTVLLKLRAQTALCQWRIEQNTRSA